MALPLKQSTAYNVILGPFVDATDGVAAEDALTITEGDIWITKAFAAPAHTANSVTLAVQTQGLYAMSLAAADTDTRGPLTIWVYESGALRVWHDFVVYPANVYDSLFGGSDYLQVDAMQLAGASAATAGEIADAVWNEESTGHTTAGYAGAQLWTDIDAVLLDTGTDGVVLAASALEASKIATDAITAAKVAADVGTEIATAVTGAAVDGAVTLAIAMKNVNAYAKGIVEIDSTALAYKAVDESTTIWTADVTATGRTIT